MNNTCNKSRQLNIRDVNIITGSDSMNENAVMDKTSERVKFHFLNNQIKMCFASSLPGDFGDMEWRF